MAQLNAEPGWRLLVRWCLTGTRRDRLGNFDRWLLRQLNVARSLSPYDSAHLHVLVVHLAHAEACDATGVRIRHRLRADLTPATPGWGQRHFTIDHAPRGVVL